MRRRRVRAKIEGVERLPDGRFRVRGEYVDPKTGRRRELDRRIEARDEIEAASIREKLLAGAAARHAERRARARLGDALDGWLAAKRMTARPSTCERYETAVERWRGAIGDYYLDAIEPDDVRGVLAGWRDAELATETINGRLRVLRTAAKDLRCSHIVEGVAALPATIDEEEADEDEGRGLTAAELGALLAAGPTAPLGLKRKDGTPRYTALPEGWPRAWALVATMAWTGLRFGEASALRWDDVDLEAGVLRVRRAQWRGIVGGPKARASKRRVVMAPDLVTTLRAHREWMLREQIAGLDSGLVFPSPRYGRPSTAKRRTGLPVELVSNSYVAGAMATACTAAGVDLGDRPALHCLRHSFNNLVRQVASEEVRRSMLGHAEEVETYTHVNIAEQRAALTNVVALVRGAKGES